MALNRRSQGGGVIGEPGCHVVRESLSITLSLVYFQLLTYDPQDRVAKDSSRDHDQGFSIGAVGGGEGICSNNGLCSEVRSLRIRMWQELS